MTEGFGKGIESMVARTRSRARLTTIAVGLSASLLAELAASAEAAPVQKVPVAAGLVIEAPVFRSTLDDYIREHSRQMRETLNEDLRRQLPGKIVLSTNALRTRT
jgi:hypothetical protein